MSLKARSDLTEVKQTDFTELINMECAKRLRRNLHAFRVISQG